MGATAADNCTRRSSRPASRFTRVIHSRHIAERPLALAFEYARLNVADALGGGPRTAYDQARKSLTSPHTLHLFYFVVVFISGHMSGST